MDDLFGNHIENRPAVASRVYAGMYGLNRGHVKSRTQENHGCPSRSAPNRGNYNLATRNPVRLS